jgi:polyhydroxyalkanoate synthesis regulator phasin
LDDCTIGGFFKKGRISQPEGNRFLRKTLKEIEEERGKEPSKNKTLKGGEEKWEERNWF